MTVRLAIVLGLASVLVASPSSLQAKSPKAIVSAFLSEVRSGEHPDAAAYYLAPRVEAHQLTSEGVRTVIRTPEDYTRHVREFIALFGPFQLNVEELIAAGDKVFVRWRQQGRHSGSVAGEMPTGKPLVEITSVVYRVQDSRIVEYWLQTDRKGFELQLERLARDD